MGEGDGFPYKQYSFVGARIMFFSVRFEWLIRQDVIIKVFLRESIQK